MSKPFISRSTRPCPRPARRDKRCHSHQGGPECLARRASSRSYAIWFGPRPRRRCRAFSEVSTWALGPRRRSPRTAGVAGGGGGRARRPRLPSGGAGGARLRPKPDASLPPHAASDGPLARRLDHRATPADEPASVALHHLVLVATGGRHQARGPGAGEREDVAEGLGPIGRRLLDHYVGHEVAH